MLFVKLFSFVAFVYGASNIIVYSHIFNPFRNFFYVKSSKGKIFNEFYKLITCMMCLPTWIGFGLSILDLLYGATINFTPANIIFNDCNIIFVPIIILMDGIIASGTTWFIHTLQESIERTWKN